MTKRIYAHLIDILALLALTVIVSYLIPIEGDLTTASFLGLDWTIDYSLKLLIVIAYYMFFDVLNNGISFGKSVMNLTILDEDGNLVRIGKRLSRSVLKSFSLYSGLFVLLLIYYFLNNKIYYDKVLQTKVTSK